MNVVMAVDPVWSYNFIGGLKEFTEVDHKVLDDVYVMTSDWVRQLNNHVVTRNSQVWNAFADNINYHIVANYPLHPSYFVSYFNMLYNQLRPGLNTMPRELSKVVPYCNPRGEIIAFVLKYI